MARLAKHADDPSSVTPVKPDTAVLCARCHTASAAKPKGFPQVDPADHSNGVPCETCHQPHSPAIDGSQRRPRCTAQLQEVRNESIATSFSGTSARGGHCVEVCAGRNAGAGSPNYKMSDHWWGMLIDIPKCIGCGNCVRACQAENDVPDGYFRTWVERYHVSDENMTNPEVISPDGGKEGFPVARRRMQGKYFFVPKMCNHCADSPCTQVCPVGATFVSPDGVVLMDQKYCLGCAYCVQACPYGCRYIHPEKKVADKCTLCYHRITKGLTTACCERLPDGRAAAGGLEESQGSDSRVSEDPQRAGIEAADGDRRKGLLQRAGWVGAVTCNLRDVPTRSIGESYERC